MKNIFSLLIMTLLLIPAMTQAQNIAINNTGASPDASAALDISSTSKGLLVPRMTSTQRDAISSPATGLMVYNTTTSAFEFYNGSWTPITTTVSSMGKADSNTYHGNANLNTVGTITSGTWSGTNIGISKGGTGQTTANASLNALLPSQSGNSGKYLTSDGTNASWSNSSSRANVSTTSDQAFAGTTWVDVTGLNFSATAGTVYKFSALIPYTNIGGSGDALDFGVSGPASPTLFVTNIMISKTASDLTRGTNSAYDTGINPAGNIVGTNLAQIEGIIITSSTGTVTIRAASNKANKHTIKAGAMLEYW